MEWRISIGIFQPKVDHLQRWSRTFRSEETEPDLSIWIPTEISGIFGLMESTQGFNGIQTRDLCDTGAVLDHLTCVRSHIWSEVNMSSWTQQIGGAKVQVTGHCFTNTESIPNTCKS